MLAAGAGSLLGVGALFLIPGIALADNCSSLSDCWTTAAGAASAAAGAAAGALGGLFGGLGGGWPDGSGDDGDGDDAPGNDDTPEPWPC